VLAGFGPMGSGLLYLDYNATSPLDPRVATVMAPYWSGRYGNASSVHAYGRAMRKAVEEAREQVAHLLGATPGEIIFTGSGTESDNLAIIGMAEAHKGKGRHLIAGATEHHAVLHAVEHLHYHRGYEVTWLPVGADGRIDPASLRAALRPDTTVVSVMASNNETGVKQPVKELAEICRERGVLFHTDAVQSAGKGPISVKEWPVSALSLSAHKFYGPSGAGVLFLRKGVAIQRVQFGGFHEDNRRPGTENVAAIVGMAEALRLAQEEGEREDKRLFAVTESLWQALSALIPDLRRNGDPVRRLGNTLNVSAAGCNGEALLLALDDEGICVSSGSACMVGKVQESHVLRAMGVPADLAGAAVRFSLGKTNTAEDVPEIASRTARAMGRIRGMPVRK
jgi:cysteine desulfurase